MLVLSHLRGLFTTRALSLFTFATGEKMVPCLVSEVRAARALFRNDSSNLSLLPFGAFADPTLISDSFHWLLLFLMAKRNAQRVAFLSVQSGGKGKVLVSFANNCLHL